MKYIFRVVFGVLLVLSSANTVAAGFEGQRFKSWTGGCEPGPHGQRICYLEQVLKQNGRDVLRAIMGYAPGKPYPTVFFELPVGIDIAAGVMLKVDKKKNIRFRGHCTEQLCSAGFMLNPPMMKQFKKGRKAMVSYLPGAGQQPIQLPVSLMGVTAGLKALPR